MRVGIEITPLTPPRRGVGTYLHQLLRHLPEALGDGVSCCAFSSGKRSPSLEDLPFLHSHRHLPVPTRLLYKSWNGLRLPKVDALLGGVDVYHATNYFLPPVRTAKRILTVYDLSFLSMPEKCSPKIVAPFSKHLPRFVREADAIMTCSEHTKDELVRLLDADADRITVISGAVEKAFTETDKAEAKARLANEFGIDAPFFLFAGLLEPRKNIDGLLRAFAHVAKDLPHKLVMIGGTGWKMDHIDALIAELTLQDRVLRPDYLPDRMQLPLFYSAAEAFIFPSFEEGFGLPILEAMACGCPVIASNAGALPEVGGDAAIYVDPEDTDGLARAMCAIGEDSLQQKDMRIAGRNRARSFSWHKSAARLAELYWRMG